MMTKDDVLTTLEHSGALFADSIFEPALIGIAEHGPLGHVAMYDRDKCIQILVDNDMSYEAAIDHFEVNVVGAWRGEKTPIFATLIESRCTREHVTEFLERVRKTPIKRPWYHDLIPIQELPAGALPLYDRDPNLVSALIEDHEEAEPVEPDSVIRANVTKLCVQCGADVFCDAFMVEPVCINCLDAS